MLYNFCLMAPSDAPKPPRRLGRKIKVRRRGKPTALAELVRKAHPVPEQVDMARVVAWWCTSLPPRIAARARPVRFRHGIVYVNTVSSAWAQELSFMADDILARLNDASLGLRVLGLRFKSGPLPPPFERRRVQRPAPPERPPAPLPATIGRALAHIADDDVRDAVERAASTSLAYEDD